MRSGSHVQLAALWNGDLELQTTSPLVIMDHWNGQQHAFTIIMFYKTNDSLEGAQREFRSFFNLGRHGRVLSKHAIKLGLKTLKRLDRL
jgi:hypothetical protein